jgi:hypothetical protein
MVFDLTGTGGLHRKSEGDKRPETAFRNFPTAVA